MKSTVEMGYRLSPNKIFQRASAQQSREWASYTLLIVLKGFFCTQRIHSGNIQINKTFLRQLEAARRGLQLKEDTVYMGSSLPQNQWSILPTTFIYFCSVPFSFSLLKVPKNCIFKFCSGIHDTDTGGFPDFACVSLHWASSSKDLLTLQIHLISSNRKIHPNNNEANKFEPNYRLKAHHSLKSSGGDRCGLRHCLHSLS